MEDTGRPAAVGGDWSGTITASARTGRTGPGADFDWKVILRDASGYPFAVGTIGGLVAVQVAATAPRGTIRLATTGDVTGLVLALAQAADHVPPAEPPFLPEGGTR